MLSFTSKNSIFRTKTPYIYIIIIYEDTSQSDKPKIVKNSIFFHVTSKWSNIRIKNQSLKQKKIKKRNKAYTYMGSAKSNLSSAPTVKAMNLFFKKKVKNWEDKCIYLLHIYYIGIMMFFFLYCHKSHYFHDY